MSSFVDYVKISCFAGCGGHGCMSFRREKFVPFGGPDGGNGGNGGSVYLEADSRLMTLYDCRLKPHFRSDKGKNGSGKNQHGRTGEDVIIHVPLGTVVTSLDDEDDDFFVSDLTEPGQQIIVAKGGRGGRGNTAFATSNNRAPRKCEDGFDGESRTLILELKMIADVGLIGLPNAGKSTLLAEMTHATPKIASYPFTTLHPNLGVMEIEYGNKITLADIPGLIEGASKGQGLGHRFLRHIERTRMFVHLVALDPDQLDFDSMWESYQIVRNELESYSEVLIDKKEIVCINQIDRVDEEFLPLVEEIQDEFRERGVETLLLSAIDDERLKVLSNEIKKAFIELQEEDEEEEL